MRILLGQDSEEFYPRKRFTIYGLMILAIFSTLPIVIVPIRMLNIAKDTLDLTNAETLVTSFIDAGTIYKNGLKYFGLISGLYFMVIAVALLAMYCVLFNLIKHENKLSQTLQHQQNALRLMIFIVIISYLFAGALNFGYGHYYQI